MSFQRRGCQREQVKSTVQRSAVLLVFLVFWIALLLMNTSGVLFSGKVFCDDDIIALPVF